MIWLLLAIAVAVALAAAAWVSLPTPTAPQAEAVDPTHPHRFVDHRTEAQRLADQAKINDAWGLR